MRISLMKQQEFGWFSSMLNVHPPSTHFTFCMLNTFYAQNIYTKNAYSRQECSFCTAGVWIGVSNSLKSSSSSGAQYDVEFDWNKLVSTCTWSCLFIQQQVDALLLLFRLLSPVIVFDTVHGNGATLGRPFFRRMAMCRSLDGNFGVLRTSTGWTCTVCAPSVVLHGDNLSLHRRCDGAASTIAGAIALLNTLPTPALTVAAVKARSRLHVSLKPAKWLIAALLGSTVGGVSLPSLTSSRWSMSTGSFDENSRIVGIFIGILRHFCCYSSIFNTRTAHECKVIRPGGIYLRDFEVRFCCHNFYNLVNLWCFDWLRVTRVVGNRWYRSLLSLRERERE